ncbi:MAG: hypothetical protein ACREM2_12410, partial [Vulcanimicrobiaceae bacterium]
LAPGARGDRRVGELLRRVLERLLEEPRLERPAQLAILREGAAEAARPPARPDPGGRETERLF